jgi:hypothetical protein
MILWADMSIIDKNMHEITKAINVETTVTGTGSVSKFAKAMISTEQK